MSNNPHYETIRAKVIAECFELIEEKEFLDQIHIITHPIRLSHVLRTSENDGRKGTIYYDCSLGTTMKLADARNQRLLRIVKLWNLELDDLSQQDPSVWEALDKMLSV